MNDRAVEIFRTFLAIVGILLLVVFGSRAAAQARNMKLAGASHKSVFAVGADIMSVLGLGKDAPVALHEPQPITNGVPAQVQTATPIAPASAAPANAADSASTNSAVDSATDSNSRLHKATGTVNKATERSQQVVNNVTKNTANDFTNLWP